MKFVPQKDFFSPETQSQYCKGLKYTARTNELRALVLRWAEKGLCVIVHDSASGIIGRGKTRKRITERIRLWLLHIQ